MQLNAAVDSDTPEELPGKVPYFHFINLEDGNKANSFLGDDANTTKVNPYANIEALLFGEYGEATE